MVVRELRVTGDRHGEAGRYDPHVDGRPSHSFLYSFMNIESPGLWTGSGVFNNQSTNHNKSREWGGQGNG